MAYLTGSSVELFEYLQGECEKCDKRAQFIERTLPWDSVV